MKRFSVAAEHARPIGDYGSSFRLLRLLRARSSEVRVDLAYLAPGDVIARHPAGLRQLFCVIAGSGFVSGEDEIEHPISAGEAAFWTQGEQHQTRSEQGLTAIIIQSPELDPNGLLPPITDPQ
jgi:mannose-6-phosphate isomerase-like protein (cupin superfamily)